MSDFLDDIQDAMDEVDQASGESFLIGGASVLANFTGAEQVLELVVSGGQSETLRGTLVVSRRRLPKAPEVLSIITGPGGTRYRVATLTPDGASWTCQLTDPHGNLRR